MQNKDQIFSRLQRSKNLPSLPQVLLKLIETCNKDDMHLSELARIIEKDPSISSRVLILVNSAYFGLSSTFSLDQAVVYLGADTIKNISLTVSVQQVFNKLKKNDHFSLNRFWWTSFSAATYAKRIARQIAYGNVEEAYLAGLLHDLGELLLLMNHRQEYAVVHSMAKTRTAQCLAEVEQFGINHCEAGAWLTRQWELNSFISDAIMYHHAPIEAVKGAFPLVKLVYLAVKCCQVQDGEDYGDLYEIGNELLGLAKDQMDTIRAGVEEEVEDVANTLGIKVKSPSQKKNEPTEEPDENGLDLLHLVKNYSLLNGFLEDLVQAESRDAIFRAIEQALKILFNVETIFFFLYDFEYKQLHGCSSTVNRHSSQLQDLVLSAEPGTSLLVKSMLERQPIISLPDADQQLDSLADSQLFYAVGGQGMLYLPLIAKNRSVGVIVIELPDSLKNDQTAKSETELLQLMINQAAISLYLDEVKRKQANKIQAARLDAASMAAAKIVHEVNNPLAIIKNYLKVLGLKLPENNLLSKELTILDEEIHRISTIIQQLDNFSTPAKHNFELTDINILLSNLLSLLSKSILHSSDLQIHFTPDPDLPVIMMDSGAIKQIIINLLKNAEEAMADGGNIYVKTNSSYADKPENVQTTDTSRDNIEISVRDDGPGLPAKILSQLFEPFSSTKGQGHSGLGLSIVHTLVKELKGSITCTSDKEQGTLFTLTLPVKQKI